MRDQPTAATSPPTKSEALAQAEQWLDWLVESGEHGWRRTSPTSVAADPTPNLPCRVLAATRDVDGVGHLPCLMLMAGKRRRNRYWQHATVDVETGVPHPKDKALAAIAGLVDALAVVADIPHPYPDRWMAHL